MVAEGVEYFHCEGSLPEWLVAVQEPHQHREEDFTLCDLREESMRWRGRKKEKEGGGREGKGREVRTRGRQRREGEEGKGRRERLG